MNYEVPQVTNEMKTKKRVEQILGDGGRRKSSNVLENVDKRQWAVAKLKTSLPAGSYLIHLFKVNPVFLHLVMSIRISGLIVNSMDFLTVSQLASIAIKREPLFRRYQQKMQKRPPKATL